VRRNEHGKPLEADLTARLGHPNLVSTLDAASAFLEPAAKLAWEVPKEAEDGEAKGADAGGTAPQETAGELVGETWLLLEYCDQGSLLVRTSPWVALITVHALREGPETCSSSYGLQLSLSCKM
jgi:hypothetical protein